MKNVCSLLRQSRFWAFGWIALCVVAATAAGAQSPAPRIAAEINASEQVPLKGSLHPLAQAQFDAGRMPANTRLEGITIAFNRSAAQQADLDALIAAQQNPSSPLYHQWLTPEQFGARFGMAQADLDKVQTWLEQQGFAVDSVARSRTFIRFSGTVNQVELAFATQMHYYTISGERHISPSTELSLPAALAPTVEAVRNLNDFKPHSMVIPANSRRAQPGFTSGMSGAVHFAPGDISVAYDVNPLANQGNTGAGQSITIAGQSAVLLSDIAAFNSAAGITRQPPTVSIVPNSGNSTIYSGDETESDLDIEWAGAMAPGATINFVYTGNSSTSNGVFDSIVYAVDEKLGNIINVSYGVCEAQLAGFSLESTFQQAQTQGQTVLAASGDSGATECFISNPVQTGDPALSIQEQVSMSYPASSPQVTGVGGTEITPANSVSTNTTYWTSNGTNDVLTSLVQYIPEVAWNDDAVSGCTSDDCISASGGGASALFSKPTWQTGVPGIPADGHRDVPDIALYASPVYPAYLYCTSDTSSWSSGQQASCNSGFRDSATGDLTFAGGTSFATPIFAGMLALINQAKGYTTGQGLINPSLYTLASNPSTYTSAFHDVTSGNNDCTAGSTFCSSSTNGFSAGTGYDQVTGLGSVDANNLSTAWPAATGPSLIATTTSVSPSNATPLVNTSVTFTVTVSSDTGTTVPSGTLTLIVDGGTPITGNTVTSNGTFTYPTSFTTAGVHQVVAQYSGDSTHAASTGTGSVTIAGVSSGKGTIALSSSPSTLTVTQGSSGNETITVTPAGGYTGTVLLTVTNFPTALNNLCGGFATENNSGYGTLVVPGTAAASITMTLDTNASDCADVQKGVGNPMHAFRRANTAKNNKPNPAPLGVAFAGLLLVGFLGRYSRKFNALAGLVALVAVGLSISACGGGNTGTTISNPPKGTYTITVTGQDSATATITGSTTFTFTIQ